MKKIVFVDMDDTIADFAGHPVFKGKYPPDVHHMYEKGFFFSLKPMEGSLIGIRALIRMGYDVHILSQPVAESAHSYAEKVQWIALWFPELISKIHFTQDKGLFKGDYLIDDNEKKWKAKFEQNGGRFVLFDYHANHAAEWNRIIELFAHFGA
jgi:5'(3')-deoxyribonucleotidase